MRRSPRPPCDEGRRSGELRRVCNDGKDRDACGVCEPRGDSNVRRDTDAGKGRNTRGDCDACGDRDACRVCEPRGDSNVRRDADAGKGRNACGDCDVRGDCDACRVCEPRGDCDTRNARNDAEACDAHEPCKAGRGGCRPIATLAEWRAQRPTWCPGCGDFAVLASLQRALTAVGADPASTVLVGGIGCSGKIAGYIGCYGFHGLHGRALPVATGVKLANRSLTVVAAGGDGDGYGIGLGHLLHTVRRDPDLTYIVMDNHVYGLTKGQASPTTDPAPASTPGGVHDRPVHPLLLALASGGTFVAQAFSGNVNHMADVIERGLRHPGFALVNVFSPCVTYNKVNTYEFYRDHLTYLGDDYAPDDRERAMATVARYNDLVCGVLYEEHGTASLDRRLLGESSTPIAQQDLAAARGWERILERYA